ncbi:unnamed protein product [Lymnaea stagnalis]|uniref:Uncharacterized protein n=1 Tax=Lymnaea stagnalis TaxID=6523 RepID=A0AAV2I810_LYMST
MLCHVLFALLAAVCAAQRWDVQSFQGPNQQSVTINYSQSQCFGLARRSRQAQVQIPTLYNIKTKQISPIPQALYNADQSVIAKLESDGWVVRNQRAFMPQLTYERVQICCPWDQNCDQNQPIQDSPDITANSPCVNGGQLTFEDGQQKCRCPTGNVKYVGKLCHIQETSQTVAPNPSSGPAIPVTTTYGRYGDMAVQDAEILRQQQRLMSQASNRPVMEPRQSPITASYDPWAQQAALWHQQALRAKFAQLEELYRRTQAFNVKGYPAFQGFPPRASPWLRPVPGRNFNVAKPIPGRGFNVPQPAPGRGINAPQPVPGRGFNVPQPFPVRGFNVPQPIPGRASPVPQNIPGRGFNVPQPAPGRGFNAPQPVPGRGFNVPQPFPVRGFNVPQRFPRRYFNFPQPIHGRDLNVPQPIRGRDSIAPQLIRGRGFNAPQPIRGRVSNAPQSFPTRDSFILQHFPLQSPANLQPVRMRGYPLAEPERGQNLFNQILKSIISKRINSLKSRTDAQNRNPYNAIISPGQLPPGMIQAAYAIRQELQQQERGPGNPYSNFQDSPYINSMANQMQGDQPPQGARVPEARTPWDLDPFGQQQNPVFMNDPRATRVRAPEGFNNDRQILALAVYKHILNQQRARLAAGSPIKSVNQPIPTQDHSKSPNPVPQPQQPSVEPPQMQAPYDITQMRQCLAKVEPKLNACFQTYDVTVEQFISPVYIEKSRKVCQNGNTVGQCIQSLEMACGEAAAPTTRQMVSSVLRTMSMVCQEIMARAHAGSQAIPVEPPVELQTQTTEQKTELPQEQQQQPAQGQQEMPTPEEQQLMIECQKVLEPVLNDCLKEYDITIDQFMNPQYMSKAQALCDDNTAVGQCIMQMDKVCGDYSQKTTKKMIHSILGMMGMVCKHIQERGGDNKISPTSGAVPIKGQPILEEKAPIEEPPMSKTIQQQPELGVPLQNQSQTEGQGEQPMHTEEEQKIMHQCQPVLQSKLNECLHQHGVTVQEFINPEYIDKARNVCQDSISVGHCLRQLDKTCGDGAILVTRKVLTSILQMMGMVCQKIQARGESPMAPATAGNQGPNNHDELVAKPTTNALPQEKETSAPSQQQPQTQESQDDLSVPTQEEQQLMQQCQPVLQNKLNECLQQHGVTVQEFINPEHIDKSRKVCQDNGAVSQCIVQLDKSCGETATVTTRKMLTTILRMMGMVCQQIQAHGDQPKPSVPAQSVQEQQEQQQHQVPKDGQAHIPGNAPHNGEHNQPTPQELESMKKCQASLEPRLNECLKGHSLTIEQFVNPDFMDKSRALCKDSNAVGECIMKLDTVCGQDAVDTTRKMIHSILSMMGGVCQKIMSLGEQGVPTSSKGIPRGPLLRSGGMPPNTPAQSKGNDVKSPLPNLASKQVPTSEDMLPSADVSNNNVPSQQDVDGASAKANTGHDTADYVSRDLEIFGYPLWLIITLILILVVLLLLFVMVTCLCVRRRRRQKKVVITKEIEKMPIPIDEKMCTVGIPPPSYTTTAVQQNEDGLALPPLDIGEDSVSVNLDESFNEKPPLYEDETADDNGKN